MSLTNIAAHTIIPALFTGGYVLDAGCRDFIFAQYAANRGCHVIALDPDPTIANPCIEDVTFMSCAIAGAVGTIDFAMTDDVEARHIASANTSRRNCGYVSVPVTTLDEIMKTNLIETWDCVKMDIEGSEYEILQAWPGPIAKQITVEFHDHVEKRPAELYDRMFAHLEQWYRVVKYYPGDTLFVLKDLAPREKEIGDPWWRS